MRKWHKLLLPVMILSPVMLLALTGCQTAPAPSSSVIEEVAEDRTAAMCESFRPEQVSAIQFESTDQWVRDRLAREAEIWLAWCD